MTDSLSLFGQTPLGGQRSGKLLDKRPRGHDGIQAVVRDVARWPLGRQHPSCEL